MDCTVICWARMWRCVLRWSWNEIFFFPKNKTGTYTKETGLELPTSRHTPTNIRVNQKEFKLRQASSMSEKIGMFTQPQSFYNIHVNALYPFGILTWESLDINRKSI
jgi:hypothetical protein